LVFSQPNPIFLVKNNFSPQYFLNSATVYTAATFGLSALSSQIEFYVKDCALKVTTNTIEIVKSNCYSKALSVKMENGDGKHVQTTSSKLSFLAFSMTNQASVPKNTVYRVFVSGSQKLRLIFWQKNVFFTNQIQIIRYFICNVYICNNYH